MFSHQPLTPITAKIVEKMRPDFFIPDDSAETEFLLQADIDPLPKPPQGNYKLFSNR
jgi:hypothetical protein